MTSGTELLVHLTHLPPNTARPMIGQTTSHFRVVEKLGWYGSLVHGWTSDWHTSLPRNSCPMMLQKMESYQHAGDIHETWSG